MGDATAHVKKRSAIQQRVNRAFALSKEDAIIEFETISFVDSLLCEGFGSFIILLASIVCYQNYLADGITTVPVLITGFIYGSCTGFFMHMDSGFFDPVFTFFFQTYWAFKGKWATIWLYVATCALMIVAQFIGGCATGFSLWGFFGMNASLGVPELAPGYPQGRAWWAIFITTLIGVMGKSLIYSAVKQRMFSPFTIMVSIAFLYCSLAGMLIQLVGIPMNPLMWFIPALFSNSWTDAWIYITSSISGGLFGIIFFAILNVLFSWSKKGGQMWGEHINRREIVAMVPNSASTGGEMTTIANSKIGNRSKSTGRFIQK